MLNLEKGDSAKPALNRDPYLSISNKVLSGLFTEMSLNTIHSKKSSGLPTDTLLQLKVELSQVVAEQTYYPSFTNDEADRMESYFYRVQGKQKPEVKKGEVMNLYKRFLQKHENKKSMLRKINLDDESSQKIKEQPINQYKENRRKSEDPIKKILTYRQMCQQSNLKTECKQKIQEAEKNFFEKLVQYQKQNEDKKQEVHSQNIIKKNLKLL